MEELLTKISSRSAKLGIMGLGYVGLPLAVEFAGAGLTVVGLDVNQGKVAKIQRGESYILDVETEALKAVVDSGHLRATTDFSAIEDVDAVIICVPTPLGKTREPDVSYIVEATGQAAKYLHPGMLVVLQSTTYPGTTEELVLPKLTETGLEVGKDFYLAFSPERVDPGNEAYTIRNVPKVVGGVTPECTRLACALYAQCIEHVVPVSSPKSAEMCKLIENTFRIINIGLVNELALLSDRLGIDIWEAIDAAATKPFGFMPFYPGPGLGGHCIPVDPFYLSWKAKLLGFEARFIELAGMINRYMPYHVVARIMDVLNRRGKCLQGASVLILGITYKADIDDIRESPALDIIQMLQNKGAEVSYNDPYIHSLKLSTGEIYSQSVTADFLKNTDCTVIITAHQMFDYSLITQNADLILDTRNALKDFSGSHIVKL